MVNSWLIISSNILRDIVSFFHDCKYSGHNFTGTFGF